MVRTETLNDTNGHPAAITVTWDEGKFLSDGSAKTGMAMLAWVPIGGLVLAALMAFSGNWGMAGTFLVIALFSFGGGLLTAFAGPAFALNRERVLTVAVDGSIIAPNGLPFHPDARTLNTRVLDAAKIELDHYRNWAKSKDVGDGNKDHLVIILTKTDGTPIFLSYSNLHRADMQPVVVALENAFSVIRAGVVMLETRRAMGGNA